MTTYDLYINGRKDKSFDDILAAQRHMDFADKLCRKGKRVAMVVTVGQTRKIVFSDKTNKRLIGETMIEIRKVECVETIGVDQQGLWLLSEPAF